MSIYMHWRAGLYIYSQAVLISSAWGYLDGCHKSVSLRVLESSSAKNSNTILPLPVPVPKAHLLRVLDGVFFIKTCARYQ